MEKHEVCTKIDEIHSQGTTLLSQIDKLKGEYRKEATFETIKTLSNLLAEGRLTERDIRYFINDLSLDIRDIYKR